MSFIPRELFQFPTHLPTWYLGHMHKFYSGLTEVLKQVDIVLEVRDARFPFSTVNPNFNKVLNGELGQSGWLT